MELLYPGNFYHIYNHANGFENLFRENENYLFFLKKYQEYISPVANTYAYALMPNHFHLLIKTHDADQLIRNIPEGYKSTGKKYKSSQEVKAIEDHNLYFISQQFSNLFNSYTKSYNKVYSRRGSLFNHPYKRIIISDGFYFTKLIRYIHFNPVKHNFVSSIEDWDYISYHELISDKDTFLQRKSVINWFGGLQEFINFHNIINDHSLKYDMNDMNDMNG